MSFLSETPSNKSKATPAVKANPEAHDTPPPPKLLEFMTSGWKPASKRAVPKVRGWQRFAARRAAISAQFPGETLVIPTGHEKVRSNSTNYRFRPGSDFYYLTGNLEPDCVLVMAPRAGGHDSILFVEPNNGKSDSTFFTDRAKGELWVGPRLGIEGSRARYVCDEARPIDELVAFLTAQATASGAKFRVIRSFSPQCDRFATGESAKHQALATALSEMRLVKDSLELSALQSAVNSTKRGIEDVIATLPHARSERELEGVFGLRARVEGNDVGYGTIAAAGAHACVLHWTRNDGPVKKGQLLLLDGGVEGNELYTADITRTIPVSGRFSREQREIYQLVLDAQKAAMEEVKPGRDFLDPNRVAMRILAHGLERLGILPMSAEEALFDEHQFYKRYSLHNVSHMLGLDVHDCAQARQEVYRFGKLRPGMVLTIEPGLYFQEDDLTVPKRYRGIGVRIEDDVVVTARGYRNLSADIPREVADVEKWIARIFKAKRK